MEIKLLKFVKNIMTFRGKLEVNSEKGENKQNAKLG